MNAPVRSFLSLPQAEIEREVARRFARTRINMTKRGARRMLAEPWRIERAMYPNVLGPVPTSISMRVQFCAARIEGELQRGRAGHRTFDVTRLLDLRDALLALRYQRRFTPVEIVSIDEMEAA